MSFSMVRNGTSKKYTGFIPSLSVPTSSIPISSTILTFFPISSTHTFPFHLLGGFSHLCSLLKITMVA